MKNPPAVDLSVQYVTDLSQEYPDLSVGIVRSSENLAGGQVVVVMDSETAGLIARVMIAETAKTDTTVDDKLWIRAGLDMMTAAALAPLRAPVVPQVGVLIDLPVSAADLDARDQANVRPAINTYPCVCGELHARHGNAFQAPFDGVLHGPTRAFLDGVAR